MARVYVTQLGKAVDVPDEYTPEQTKQHITGLLPQQQPTANQDNMEPDFTEEHRLLGESQLRDQEAAQQIRQNEVDPEANWANAGKSALYGARNAYAGGMRGLGEMLPDAAGRLKEFLVEDMGDYNQTVNARQKMAHDDPSFDFENSMLGWQGNIPDTARALVQESGPTALFAAEMAIPGMVAGKALKAGRAIKAGTQALSSSSKLQQPIIKALAKYEDVVSHLPAFFQRGAMIAPAVAGMRASEALTEAGMSAQEATKRGKTAAEIKATTAKTFAANMTLGVMDVAQATLTLGMLPPKVTKALGNVSRDYIGKMPMALFKAISGIAASAGMEGGEEAIQEEISAWAQGEGFDPKVVYNPIYAREKHPAAFNIGALTGIVGAGGHVAFDTLIGEKIDKLTPEQQAAIWNDPVMTPEAQKARREDQMAAQQRATAEATGGENGVIAAETASMDPLTSAEVGPDIINKFAELSDEDLALDAMHSVQNEDLEAEVVLAHRERIGRGEVKASVRKDKARAQDALDAHEATLEKAERQEFAQLSQAERRQQTEESMLDPAAFPQGAADQNLPADPIAAMEGAESYEALVSLATAINKEGLLTDKNKAVFRREEQRLNKDNPPGFERFVPGADGSTQTKTAGSSIVPVQAQEEVVDEEQTDIPTLAGRGKLPAGETPKLLGPGNEVENWEGSPLKEIPLKSIPTATSVVGTTTGARATLADGSYLHFEGVDYINPDSPGVSQAVAKHQTSDIGGVPAYVKDNPDGSKTIVLSKGYSWATTANKQSLDHEIFHVAKSLGVLTKAEIATVYARYMKKALMEMGIKTKTSVRQLLDMDPDAILDKDFTARNLLEKVEELSADGYGDWAPQHKNIINKIYTWLKSIANIDLSDPHYSNNEGASEKVFEKIRSGEGLQLPMDKENTFEPDEQRKMMAQVRANIPATKTPEFQQEFEGSEAVTDDGDPLLCGHGTISGDRFDTPRLGDLGPHFAGVHTDVPNMFAKTRKSVVEGKEGSLSALGRTYARVYPAYLIIKNPIHMPDMNSWDAHEVAIQAEGWLEDDLSGDDLNSLAEYPTNDKTVRILQKYGVDGVSYLNRVELYDESTGSATFLPEYIEAHQDEIIASISETMMEVPPHWDLSDPMDIYATEIQDFLIDHAQVTDEEFLDIIPGARQSYIPFDPENQVVPATAVRAWLAERFPKTVKVEPAVKPLVQTRQALGELGKTEEQLQNANVASEIANVERRIGYDKQDLKDHKKEQQDALDKGDTKEAEMLQLLVNNTKRRGKEKKRDLSALKAFSHINQENIDKIDAILKDADKAFAQVRKSVDGVKPAIWTKDKVFTGAMHYEAFEKALEEYPVLATDNDQKLWMDGFLFPDGRFLNRAETLAEIGIETSEELTAVKRGLRPDQAYDGYSETNPEVSDEELDAIQKSASRSLAQVRDIEQYRKPDGEIFNPLVMDEIEEKYPEELKTAQRLAAEVFRVKEQASGKKMTSLRKRLELNDILLEYWPDKFGPYEEELEGMSSYAADNDEWDDVEKELLDKERAESGGPIIDAIQKSASRSLAQVRFTEDAEQEIGSSETSTPQRPATFKKVKDKIGWVNGSVNADIGGGKYDILTNALKEEGVENVVYDRFNRTSEENAAALKKIGNEQADTATVNNVLNVIKERKSQQEVIRNAYSVLKPGGNAYFLMHDGNRSSVGGETSKGWQRNETLDEYLPMIKAVFPEAHKKYGMIVAPKGEASLFNEGADIAIDEYKASVRKLMNKEQVEGYDAFVASAHESQFEMGELIEVYHGSFHDVSDLDLDKVDMYNYLGRAFYMTESPADASENYASATGADRDAKKSMVMEEVGNYIENQWDEEYGDEPFNEIVDGIADVFELTISPKEQDYLDRLKEAYNAAEELEDSGYIPTQVTESLANFVATKKILGEASGRVYPLLTGMKNPVQIAGAGATGIIPDETTWSVEFNEESEEFEGSAITLFDALEEIAGPDAVGLVQEELQSSGVYWTDGDDISASDFLRAMDATYAIQDVADEISWDENGGRPVTTGEVTRRVFHKLGFDGAVMDASVFAGMEHVRGTRHFISWEEGNVKSALSPGAMDRASSNISTQVRPLVTTKNPKYFKSWFGNSVAVDDDGKPLVFYHGTVNPEAVEYGAMDINKVLSGQTGTGFYFSSSTDVMNHYNNVKNRSTGAGQSYPVYLSIQDPFVWDKTYKVGTKEHANIIEFLEYHKEHGENGWYINNAEMKALAKVDFDGDALMAVTTGEAIRDVLIAAGYDGITHISVDGIGSPRPNSGWRADAYDESTASTTMMAFWGNQAKSVFNSGFYSQTNDNMSLQVRSAMARPPGMTEDQFDQANEASGVNDPSLNAWFGGKERRFHLAAVMGRDFQKRIAKAAGQKSLGMFGFIYGKKARDYGAALHVYMDLKNDPEAYDKYYDKLTEEQKRWTDIAVNEIPNNPELLAIAADLRIEYDKAYNESKDAGLIHNFRENYVNRVWRLNGRSASESNQAFGTTTRHRRKRVLPTILQGWADGLDLAATDAVENLVVYKEEIGRVIEDKAVIDRSRRLRLNGEEGAPFLMTHIPPKGYKYSKINHPNFKYYVPDSTKDMGVITAEPEGANYKASGNGISFRKFAVYKPGGKVASGVFETWDKALEYIQKRGDNTLEVHERWDKMRREDIYAPADMAEHLNKILDPGFNSTAMQKALRYNALIKSVILLTSLFHHMAFARSFWLGTHGSAFNADGSKLGKHRILKAYKEGMRMVDAHNETIEYLMQNGLTLGRLQDWDDSVYRDKNKFIEWMKSKGKVSKAIIEKAGELRERQVSFLFKNFGAGLKTQAALIEYAHNLKKYQGKMDPQQIAQYTARLINEDFGGLNWDRMGVSKKRVQLLRLLFLAPDWTGSNFLTIKRLSTSLINKGNDPKAMRDIYGRFWGGILMKGLMATLAMNLIMGMLGKGMGDDGELLDGTKHAFRDDWTRLLWADVDITPLYKLANKAFDGENDGRRRYFSIFGHFKDPFRWAIDPARSAIHKGSPLSRVVLEAIEGTDWKGDGFTTVNELFGNDEKGYYKSDGPGHKAGDPKGGQLKGNLTSRQKDASPLAVSLHNPGESQLLSYLISQAKGSTPVQVQETLAALHGEKSWFDATLRSFGAHMSPSRGTEYDVVAKKLTKLDQELMALRSTNKTKYAEERKNNAPLVKASRALLATEKRIRTFNKKMVALEGNKRLPEEKRDEMRGKYQEKINELEERFMEMYGGIV